MQKCKGKILGLILFVTCSVQIILTKKYVPIPPPGGNIGGYKTYNQFLQQKGVAWNGVYSALMALSLQSFDCHHMYWVYKDGHGQQVSDLDRIWKKAPTGANIDAWKNAARGYPEMTLHARGRAEFLQDPANLKYYMGMLCGRSFFIRKIGNDFKFDGRLLSQNGSQYIFNNEKTQNSRFFVIDYLNPFIKNNTISTSALTKLRQVFIGSNEVRLISLAGKDDPSYLGLGDGSILLMNNNQFWADSRLSTEDFSNSLSTVLTTSMNISDLLNRYNFFGMTNYRINALKPHQDTHFGKGSLYHREDNYMYLLGVRPSDMNSNAKDVNLLVPFLPTTFLQTIDKPFLIPIVIPGIKEFCYLDLFAIPILSDQVTFAQNSENKSFFKLSLTPKNKKMLANVRAACQDMAASKDYVAFVGVGRSESILGEGSPNPQNFDPYDGKNYFFYIKVSKNLSLPTLDQSKTPLNAEAGLEGQHLEDVDPAVFCTDSDLPDDSGSISFVQFDSAGNLYFSTSEGALFVFPSSVFGSEGKKTPIKLKTPFKILNFSAGKGVLISDYNGFLYYLNPDDAAFALKNKGNANWISLSPVLQSSVFAITQEGCLLFVPRNDSSNLYSALYSEWLISASDLFSKIDADSSVNDVNLKNKQRVATFCHLILNRTNRTYSSLQLDDLLYPSITTTADAVNLINEAAAFFGNIEASFWDISDNIDLSQDMIDALGLLKSKFISDNNFAQVFNTFYQQVLRNRNFQSTSLRQKLQNIDSLLSAGDDNSLSQLKKLIDSLVKNQALMLGKSGFFDLETILNAKRDGDLSKGKLGASLFVSWLNKVQTNLIKAPNITSDVVSAWVSSLNQIEKTGYLDIAGGGTTTGILASVAASIDLITANQNLDQLISKDKKELLSALQKIVSNINYLTLDELDKVRNSLDFLNAKFNLEQDAAFNVNGRNIILQIKQGLQIDFGVKWLIAQFKAIVSSLESINVNASVDSENMMTRALSILKQIIGMKADFEVRSLNSEKRDFINYLLDLLAGKNTSLQNYENKFKKGFFDDNSFYSQLYLLNDSAIVEDYVVMFETWSGLRSDDIKLNSQLSSTINIAKNNLMSNVLSRQISQQALNSLNASIDKLVAKGISGLTKINLSSLQFNFQSFLSNIMIDVNINRDSQTKLWRSDSLLVNQSNSISFIGLCRLIKLFSQFGFDVNNYQHKFGFIGILNFIQKSAKDLLNREDSKTLNAAYLSKVVNEVNDLLKMIVKTDISASNASQVGLLELSTGSTQSIGTSSLPNKLLPAF